MPDYKLNFMGSTTGTYATTSSPFMNVDEWTEYLGKYEENKSKWLSYAYGNYGDIELKVVSSLETVESDNEPKGWETL